MSASSDDRGNPRIRSNHPLANVTLAAAVLLSSACSSLHPPLPTSLTSGADGAGPSPGSAFTSALGLSGEEYVDASYLRLQDEALLQVQLVAAGRSVEPSSVLTAEEDAAARGLAREVIYSQARVAAKLRELRMVARAEGFQGHAPTTAWEAVPTGSLQGARHDLQVSLSRLADADPRKPLARDLLAAAEDELRRRQLLPRGGQGRELLLEQRFLKVAELNLAAVEEARHFIDQSPLVLDTRRQIAELEQAIREIDRTLGVSRERLPRAGGLLTRSTLQERLETLSYGARKLEAKTHLLRHYSAESEMNLRAVQAALRAEEVFSSRRRREIISQGRTLRGPPDLTLGSFLDEIQVQKISDSSVRSFRRVLNRQGQRFEALHIGQPAWAQVELYAPRPPPPGAHLATVDGYMKGLATWALRLLPIDPVEAALYEAELRTARASLGRPSVSAQDLPTLSNFLGNDLPLIDRLMSELDSGIRLREKKAAGRSGPVPPALDSEIRDLKAARHELAGQRSEVLARISSGKGPQPPPEIESWKRSRNLPEELPPPTEDFYRYLVSEWRRALERKAASYGYDAPPSVELGLGKIRALTEVNDASRALESFAEYSKFRPLRHLFENLDTFKELNFGQHERELADEIHRRARALRGLNPRERSHFSQRLDERIANAQRALPVPRVDGAGLNPDTKPPWREAPSSEIRQQLNRTRSPGGIWLSPKGRVHRRYLPEDLSRIIDADEDCGDGEMGWHLDDRNIRCHPAIDIPDGLRGWLEEMGPLLPGPLEQRFGASQMDGSQS